MICASFKMRRSRLVQAWRSEPFGSRGDLVAFSFHPNKNMTTIEGGALVVNDEDEAQPRIAVAISWHSALARWHARRRRCRRKIQYERRQRAARYRTIGAARRLVRKAQRTCRSLFYSACRMTIYLPTRCYHRAIILAIVGICLRAAATQRMKISRAALYRGNAGDRNWHWHFL